MTKPIITLTNIKVNDSLSAETNCYTATLFVDGVKFGVVGNRGNGGCDDILDLAPGKTHRDFHALDKLISETYEPEEFHGMMIQQSLETLCGDEVTKFLVTKDYRRQIKTKVLFIKPDEKGVYQNKLAPHTLEKWTAHLTLKHPGVTILNNLPEAEAVELFNKLAA